ncbi:MAG: antibiotic biosynthesis monooxygenase [Eubacteriaceae bacterium]|jgi:quinol monooxygenase YgiN|nr:antibiotic biosynthesis monooxygenase [Eubacteriaceae bacterium]
MIKVVAKNYTIAENQKEILKLADELVKATRKESGNISYAVYKDIRDPEIITMIEEWENQGALDAHMNAEYFNRIVSEMSRYMTKEPEINIYEQVL